MTNPITCQLYRGYERKWAFYKVAVMVFKLVLVVPVIILWDRLVAQVCQSSSEFALALFENVRRRWRRWP
jgi:hypothetical protein